MVVRRLLDEDRNSEMKDIKLEDETAIRARRQGKIEVTVKDSGVGLSKDQLEELFSDGKQFNPNALQAGQGSGIGLYLAEGIAEQHEGSLIASSEGIGKGATFTLELPLWRVESTSCQTASSTTLEPNQSLIVDDTSEEETTELRILVVDDVRSNRRLLSRLLQNKGHICDEAEEGAMAVDMVRQAVTNGEPYHSILMGKS